MIKALARWILKDELLKSKHLMRFDKMYFYTVDNSYYQKMAEELLSLPDRTQRHKAVVNKYLMLIERDTKK